MAANQPSPVTGERSELKRIRLTFDAEHPNRPQHRSESVDDLLDILGTYSVKAMFFIQGRWVTAYPRVAARIVREGHSIGSHSNAHVRMTRLSDEGIKHEVLEAENRIRTVTGVSPRPFFRCPYGDGHHDARVVELLSAMGYQVVGWDVDPQDFNEHRTTADVVEAVQAEVSQAPTSDPIVLLHTWPASTPDAVRQIVSTAQERGFRVATFA